MTDQTREEAGRKPGSVAQRINNARDSLPGERNALPPGTLPGHSSEPQGDENRQPVRPPTPPP